MSGKIEGSPCQLLLYMNEKLAGLSPIYNVLFIVQSFAAGCFSDYMWNIVQCIIGITNGSYDYSKK